jgi:hypothetical protein
MPPLASAAGILWREANWGGPRFFTRGGSQIAGPQDRFLRDFREKPRASLVTIVKRESDAKQRRQEPTRF